MDLRRARRSPKRRFVAFFYNFDLFERGICVQELLSGVGRLTVTVDRAEGLSKEWMDSAMSLERYFFVTMAVINDHC